MTQSNLEKATIGGGCFWCLEAVFQRVEPVVEVISGYSGGDVENPTYKQVCSGKTGHAEVIQLSFDPEAISYREILKRFFAAHDPTQLNRQGADIGTQYRSVIFYHNETQRRIAGEMISRLNEDVVYDAEIVTELKPFEAFYPAEEVHQDYYKKHPDQPYCVSVIKPKLDKYEKLFDE